MTPDTKRQIASAGGLVAVIAAVTTGGVYLSQQFIAPAPSVVFSAPLNRLIPDLPGCKLRLEWDDALEPDAVRLGWVTDVYTTTNLKDFTALGYVTTNRLSVAATNFMGFYVTRHRNTNDGQVTVWNIKL